MYINIANSRAATEKVKKHYWYAKKGEWNDIDCSVKTTKGRNKVEDKNGNEEEEQIQKTVTNKTNLNPATK